MDRIQIISYRPNHDDYCRGHRMHSTDSEFIFEDHTDTSLATDVLAAIMFATKQEEGSRIYGQRETHVFVNGVSENLFLYEEDGPDAHTAQALAQKIYGEAKHLFEVNWAAHLKAEEERKATEEARIAEEARQRDIQALAALKKKLGVE